MSITKPGKRHKYDETFKTEALRLARESHSTRAATRQLGIGEKLLCRWRQAQTIAKQNKHKSIAPYGPRTNA